VDLSRIIDELRAERARLDQAPFGRLKVRWPFKCVQRARGSGPGGRSFKSSLPDQLNIGTISSLVSDAHGPASVARAAWQGCARPTPDWNLPSSQALAANGRRGLGIVEPLAVTTHERNFLL
jgi:hypothetical protein